MNNTFNNVWFGDIYLDKTIEQSREYYITAFIQEMTLFSFIFLAGPTVSTVCPAEQPGPLLASLFLWRGHKTSPAALQGEP